MNPLDIEQRRKEIDDVVYEETEKIYFTTSIEEVGKECNSFFDEISNRRRGKEAEEGLQAVAIISPDKFGAKICDDDGNGYHNDNAINLYRFFEGKKLLSSDQIFFSEEAEEDYRKLLESCVCIRILSSEEILTFIVFYEAELSEFQKKSIQMIIDLCNDIKTKGFYSSVQFGIYGKNCHEEVERLTENKSQRIYDSLMGNQRQ